jgi:hypothetical protein
LKYYLADITKFPLLNSKEIFKKMLQDRYAVIKKMNADDINKVVSKTDTLVELTLAVIVHENPAAMSSHYQKETFDDIFSFFKENAPGEFEKFNNKANAAENQNNYDFGIQKSDPIPIRPPISKEEAFVEWMLRYDEDTELFRQMISDGNLDHVVMSTTKEIIREVNENPSGEMLMDKLGTIGEYYQESLKPIIEKRRGIEFCPEEIQIVFLAFITKMLLLPYFVKYKYNEPVPEGFLPLKEL